MKHAPYAKQINGEWEGACRTAVMVLQQQAGAYFTNRN